MIPSTRAEAKTIGASHYFTGEPCRNDHIEPRFTGSGVCMACAREKSQRWALLNRDKYIERKTISNEKRKHKNKLSAAEWRKKNPSRKNAIESVRRATCRRQTPSWADQDQIVMWYEVANVLSRGGVKFHVDHVFPLRGKGVCGLHSQDNLQVLPWHLNLRKGNKNGN
jgi:hypothetical protein